MDASNTQSNLLLCVEMPRDAIVARDDHTGRWPTSYRRINLRRRSEIFIRSHSVCPAPSNWSMPCRKAQAQAQKKEDRSAESNCLADKGRHELHETIVS